MVFALDPQMRVPEERLYVRVEDTVVVTEEGIENLTIDAPLELDEVEALMKESGLLDRFPAQGWQSACQSPRGHGEPTGQ